MWLLNLIIQGLIVSVITACLFYKLSVLYLKYVPEKFNSKCDDWAGFVLLVISCMIALTINGAIMR